MIAQTSSFSVSTKGKGTYEISDQVQQIVSGTGIKDGTATVFLAHTSASLVLYENADSTARKDLHQFFEDLVPEDADYIHDSEGPDDSTSHLRMALTRSSEVVPIKNSRLCLGTWQGIFVFEHRRHPHSRNVYVTVLGT